eukprot:7389945-Prymnesium_polylepis.2
MRRAACRSRRSRPARRQPACTFARQAGRVSFRAGQARVTSCAAVHVVEINRDLREGPLQQRAALGAQRVDQLANDVRDGGEDEDDSDDDPQYRERFCRGRRRIQIAVPDGRHGHRTKVDGIGE